MATAPIHRSSRAAAFLSVFFLLPAICFGAQPLSSLSRSGSSTRPAFTPTTKPTTRPAPRPKAAPAAKRATEWRAKPDAPDIYKLWITHQPLIRMEWADRMKQEIKQLEMQRTRETNRSVKKIDAGYAGSEVDLADQLKKRKRIAELSAEAAAVRRNLRTLEAGELLGGRPLPPVRLDERIGSIGELRVVNVIQVIDEHNAIVRPLGSELDDDRMIWAKGFDTTNWVDDKAYTLASPDELAYVAVTGKKTYRTALGGTNTVFVLERFDLYSYVEEVEAGVAAAAPSTAPSEPMTKPVPKGKRGGLSA